MSIAATVSHVPMRPTPFCEKSCKGARVLGQLVLRSLYSVCLLVIAIACRIFSKDLYASYFSMSKAQWIRGANSCGAYFEFKNHLINFSYNGCILPPSAKTELQALRNRYGDRVIDRYLQVGTKEMPLKKEKLKRRDQGFCLAVSLDCIEKYLKEIQKGIDPKEAICRVSERYVSGAPDEAQIAQIFYGALDIDSLFNQKKGDWERKLKEEMEKALEKGQEDLGQVLAMNLPEPELDKEVSRVEAQTKQHIDSIRQLFLRKVAELEAHRSGIIAKQFSLKLSDTKLLSFENMEQEAEKQFLDSLETLPDGCYLGGFRSEKKAHAIALIKVDKKYFLVDSNFGAAELEKKSAARKIWELGKGFYMKHGVRFFSLSSCKLM